MDDRESRPQATTIRLRSWVPAALGALLVLLQLVSPNRIWIILLCGVGGMVLAAYLWARSLARSVRVTRSLRFVWARVGDLLEEWFSLENRGAWPLLWAEVEDKSTLPGYPPGDVVSAGSHETYRWRVTTVCRRRGVFTLGPWSLHMGDPFGLFSVTQRYGQSESLMVVPTIMDLPPLVLPRGVAAGGAVARQPAADLTLNVSGTRLYAPGDPLKRIHWPSTAHHGTLVSKTFDAEISGDLWIVLDLDAAVQAGEGEESTVEYGVILAASLADYVLRQHRAVGLVAYGAAEPYLAPGWGEGQLWRILHTLAGVQVVGSASLATVLGEMRALMKRHTTLAVVTPSGDPAWVEALWPMVRGEIVATAILLDPTSFGRPADLSAVRGMLTGLGIPTHLIAQGYAFRPAAHAQRPAGRWEFKTTATGRVIVVRRPQEVVR